MAWEVFRYPYARYGSLAEGDGSYANRKQSHKRTMGLCRFCPTPTESAYCEYHKKKRREAKLRAKERKAKQ